MSANARQAYDKGKKATGSTRELESAALFKAARMLEQVKTAWEEPERDERLRRAIKHNQQLWTLFQTELVRPDHEMPRALRLNLLRLSAFIDRRSFEVLGKPDPTMLQALIDINRQIASGLASNPEP
jgi:flagellar biosynthesis activator protein FlaF